MSGESRTYILSVREPEGRLVLEDVRTRRRALLTDLSKIADQIDRWSEDPPVDSPQTPDRAARYQERHARRATD
jgi:hypothetical protein